MFMQLLLNLSNSKVLFLQILKRRFFQYEGRYHDKRVKRSSYEKDVSNEGRYLFLHR